MLGPPWEIETRISCTSSWAQYTTGKFPPVILSEAKNLGGRGRNGMATQTAATDQFIQANGLRLHYLDYGNPGATPLVMLHGLRGFAHTWDPVALPLAGRFHGIALDQRGRGQSEWAPDVQYNTAAYVSDLEELVSQLGFSRFVLMGHS